MTNEEKFSPRFGFEAGVLVEVARKDSYVICGYFCDVHDSHLVLMYAVGSADSWHLDIPRIPLSDIEWIKIRSGPWRFWAEAVPKDAKWVALHYSGDISFWYNALMPEAKDGIIRLERPWWAT